MKLGLNRENTLGKLIDHQSEFSYRFTVNRTRQGISTDYIGSIVTWSKNQLELDMGWSYLEKEKALDKLNIPYENSSTQVCI